MPPPSARRLAAVALACGAGATALVRVAGIGPSLDVTAWRYAHNPVFDIYYVVAKVRGGEPIEEVAIEPVSGPLSVLEGAFVRDLPARGMVTFQVRVEGGGAGRVRVFQKGAAARTYDVEIAAGGP